MEEEDPAPTYSAPARKPIFRRDRHLQSALNNGEVTYMFANWTHESGLKREHIMLKNDTQDAQFLPSEQFIHWALIHISRQPPNIVAARTLPKHLRVANEATGLGCFDYCGVTFEGPKGCPPALLADAYSWKTTLNHIMERITFSENHHTTYKFFGCHGAFPPLRLEGDRGRPKRTGDEKTKGKILWEINTRNASLPGFKSSSYHTKP